MSAEDAIDLLKPVPLTHHVLSPLAVFFGGLENEVNSTGKFVPQSVENFCRSKQHGSVTVMTAGMHHALDFGIVRKLVFFRYRQSIHIGPQGDGIFFRPRQAAPDDTDDTDTLVAGYVGDAELVKLTANQLRGLELLTAGLRMTVQLSSYIKNVVGKCGRQFFYLVHSSLPLV